MTIVRVHNFSMSVDGFAAGPDQDLDNPMGVGGMQLHAWALATVTYRRLFGLLDSDEVVDPDDVDDRFAARGDDGIGATVMGRNMFGPVRGPWPDDSWQGWWGDEPPFHHPVFVLTHHRRDPLVLGETTFHFVTDGLAAAMALARGSAGGADVRLGGGTATVRAALAAGMVDDLHVAVAPVVLGVGERLFDHGVPVPPGYECAEATPGRGALHLRFVKRSS